MEKSIKNRKEAIAKMQEIAGSTRTCMFHTMEDAWMNTSPMTTLDVDDEGNFWFFSSKQHDLHEDLLNDNQAQISLYDDGSGKYLALRGEVQILHDQPRIEKYWSPIMETWYDGKDDPNLVVLCFQPLEAKYWENKDGKLMSLFKMAKSAVTGEKSNIGVSGELHV